jgi:myo-inositol 2-dehydrogenase / D-chiro-inositol 1-dehydrogenase
MAFKICVIGCGEIAIGYHGPSYAKYADENPSVELAACCARRTGTAARFAEQFGFKRSYTDYLQMLEQERPDAVCLNVPPELVCEFSCEILDQGLPLLLEKPPGLTVAEIDRMITAAANSGVPHQVAFNRRFTPLTRALKRMLTENLALGEIQHIRVDFTRLNRTEADFSITAIHGIDTARFLAGSDFTWARFHYQDLSSLGSGVANIFIDC